jgi:hypothetical protein
MTICFNFAQSPLCAPNVITNTLRDFAFDPNTDTDYDASKGAVWAAGREGLEPKLSPSLSSAPGVLFLVSMYWGAYGGLAATGNTPFKTYEGMLNGQRYAITFSRRVGKVPWGSTESEFMPLQVGRISEFTVVKEHLGKKTEVGNNNSAPGPANAPSGNAVYFNASNPPKPILSTSSSTAVYFNGQMPPTQISNYLQSTVAQVAPSKKLLGFTVTAVGI